MNTIITGHTIDEEARKYERVKEDLNEIVMKLDLSKDRDRELFEMLSPVIDRAQEFYSNELDEIELFI